MFTSTDSGAIASRNAASTSGGASPPLTAVTARRRRPRATCRAAGGCDDRIDRLVAARDAPAADDRGAERCGLRGDRLPDRAEADDQPRRSGHLAELVAIPRHASLCVTPELGLLEMIEHRAQHELADRDVRDVRVGEAHATLEHGREHRAVQSRVRDAQPPQRGAAQDHPEERPKRALVGVEQIERRCRDLELDVAVVARPPSVPSFCIAIGSYASGSRSPMRSSVPCVRRSFR